MNGYRDKIKTKAELIIIVTMLKKVNKMIVTTNGSFDLLHAGHANLLEGAKSNGDILIVGVNSDKSVQAYKGISRPIIKERFRAEAVAAFASVDYVIILGDGPDISCDLIRLVKPDVHCNSSSYGSKCIEAEVIKEVGGELVLIPPTEGISTSEIIERIRIT